MTSHTGVGNLFIVTSTLPIRKVKTRATFTGLNHRASSKRNLVTCRTSVYVVVVCIDGNIRQDTAACMIVTNSLQRVHEG